LSFVLDENALIESNTQAMEDFINKQIVLLEALTNKFPNVTALSQNLQLAKDVSNKTQDTYDKLTEENNQIFVAMELMQFNDINRQKIERVMSVIKKLSQYLNGLFEDDSSKPEIQIAKHISGDASDTVDADDIESLIADYSS
jgi:RNAse (barnase) inhibitor barstar